MRANRGLFLSLAIIIFTLFGILFILWVVRQNPNILVSSWQWLRIEGNGTESGSTTIRNIGLVLAGVVALFLGLWRSFVAQKQANAAHTQSAVAHQSLLNERYQQGAQMLGSEVESVRLGGIYTLRSLSEQHAEEYHLEVSRLLCAFIRHPTGFTPSETSQSETDSIPLLREDVQVALDAICACHELNTNLEVHTPFWLDFREANLNGARLASVNLTVKQAIVKQGLLGNTFAELIRLPFGADFTNASLHSARMDIAKLPRAKFTGADLSATHLGGSDLSGATLQESNMRSAFLMNTDLSGAKLWDANLSNAMLNNANLTGTEFVSLHNGVAERHARGLTQSQLDEATSDPLDPPKLEGVTDAETGMQLVWNQ